MTQALAALSAAISQVMVSATPMLSAIRVGQGRHITGLVCQDDTIVTTDQALPALDSYTVALSSRVLLVAHPGPRDPAVNLAVLHLDKPWQAANPEVATAAVGSVVVLVGAEADASPTVRLTVIHRFLRTVDGPAPVLDLSVERVDQGSLVLDLDGRLVGMVAFGPNREPVVIPSALIGRMLAPGQSVASAKVAASVEPPPPPPPPPGSAQRGWLGVALQPITVPDALVGRAGQTSGRMVVSITKGGPAELAGIRIGDVLLSLNDTSTSGPHSLRAFLGADRIGTTVEVKLLREGTVVAGQLTIAAQPE